MSQSFFTQVHEIVGRIPRGKVATYGQIAFLLASPRGARAVGWAMRQCPGELPWHRVIRSDGTLASIGPWELQRMLLEAEGIPFLPDGRVDIAVCQFKAD